MSFLSKLNDLVFGPEDDDEVDFAADNEPSFDFDQPAAPAPTSKKPKVVNIAATTQLKLSTKKRGFCLVMGVVVLTLGFFMLSTSTSIYVILVSILPVVIGNALVNILFGATVKDLIPEGKAGLFQGIRMIFAVMLPMVIGPVIGDKACQSAAQTIMNEVGAEVIVPSKNMFLWAGVVCIFALIPLYFLVRKGVDNIEESQEEKSENVA